MECPSVLSPDANGRGSNLLTAETITAMRHAKGVIGDGMIDSNPAKQGVDNPQRRRTEKRPFESWAQLAELAAWLGPRYGPPVLFAAATGLRPGEWMALEQRDIDLWGAQTRFMRRSCIRG